MPELAVLPESSYSGLVESPRGLATLIGRFGVPSAGELQVMGRRVRLGRDPESDLVLAGPTISQLHAELELRGGVWWLTDLASDEGSWIDEERVMGTAPLAPGSILRLGLSSFVFSPTDEWADSILPVVAPLLPPEAQMTVAWPRRDEPMAPEFLWPERSAGPRWWVYAGGALLLGVAIFYIALYLIRIG